MYYALLAYDIPARFAFLIALIVDPKTHPFVANPLFFSTFLFGVDLFRRFCWFLLRIESEQVNNYEKFRTLDEIPEVNDEVEEETMSEAKYSNMVTNILNQIENRKTQSRLTPIPPL